MYEPSEIGEALKSRVDLAFQFPYNILDRRFETSVPERGKRYCRSVFLQGLLLANSIRDSAPEGLKSLHSKIRQISFENGISMLQLAVGFVAGSQSVDHYLIGAESVGQLSEIVQAPVIDYCEPPELRDLISSIDKKWLDPREWS